LLTVVRQGCLIAPQLLDPLAEFCLWQPKPEQIVQHQMPQEVVRIVPRGGRFAGGPRRKRPSGELPARRSKIPSLLARQRFRYVPSMRPLRNQDELPARVARVARVARIARLRDLEQETFAEDRQAIGLTLSLLPGRRTGAPTAAAAADPWTKLLRQRVDERLRQTRKAVALASALAAASRRTDRILPPIPPSTAITGRPGERGSRGVGQKSVLTSDL
jgi:hypothetical protein